MNLIARSFFVPLFVVTSFNLWAAPQIVDIDLSGKPAVLSTGVKSDPVVTTMVTTTRTVAPRPTGDRPLSVAVTTSTAPRVVEVIKEHTVYVDREPAPVLVDHSTKPAAEKFVSVMSDNSVLVPAGVQSLDGLVFKKLGGFVFDSDALVFTPELGGTLGVPSRFLVGTLKTEIKGLPASLLVTYTTTEAGKDRVFVQAGKDAVSFMFYDSLVELGPLGGLYAQQDSTQLGGYSYSVMGGRMSMPKPKGLPVVETYVKSILGKSVTFNKKADSVEVSVARKAALVKQKESGLLFNDVQENLDPDELDRVTEEEKLLLLPTESFRFRNATLTEAVSLLATLSGMTYTKGALEDDDRPVVGDVANYNPFRYLMQLVAERGYVLDYRKGMWTFRRYADDGLITRTYKVRYDDQEESSRSAASGGASAGSGLSTSAGAFSSKSEKLMKDVEALLKLTEAATVVTGDATKDSTEDGIKTAVREAAASGGGVGSAVKAGSKASSMVFYSSRTKTLHVLATRYQHEQIRAYLRAFDRPSRMIAYEVKIVETLTNPINKFGVDYPDSISVKAGFPDNYRLLGKATNFSNTSSNGTTDSTTAGSTTGSTTTPVSNGFGMVLNGVQANMLLNFLQSDTNTRNVSYYSPTAIEGDEVSLRNIVQDPIVQGTSLSAGTTSGSTSQNSSIQYIPIGVALNIRGQVIDDNAVKMQVSGNFSDSQGNKVLLGNEVPVVATRDFGTTAIVRSGDSVALAGLERERASNSVRKIPLLGDIPFLGYLFKSKSNQTEKTYVLVFVTPTILGDYSTGITDIRKGTNLGRTRSGYIPGVARSVDDLKFQSEGVFRQVDDLYGDYEVGNLTAAKMAEVDALRLVFSQVLGELGPIMERNTTPDAYAFKERIERGLNRMEFLLRYTKKLKEYEDSDKKELVASNLKPKSLVTPEKPKGYGLAK
jgi:Flp pilus assembly secretin CpaC